MCTCSGFGTLNVVAYYLTLRDSPRRNCVLPVFDNIKDKGIRETQILSETLKIE